MCGLAGIWFEDLSDEIDISTLLNQIEIYLKPRGPDSGSKWISSKNKFGMIHRRLEIIGLGQSGKQPIQSKNGRFVMTFNGEIYNFRKLFNELNNQRKFNFDGISDTEVLVELFEKWGIKNTLNKLEGMFAISIWDNKEKELSLIRDRFGEKPLYFGEIFHKDKRCLIFSSDIACFTKISSSSLEINIDSYHEFINKGWISKDKTIYKRISKVLPGEMLKIKYSNNIENFTYSNEKYWDYNSLISFDKYRVNNKKTIEELNQLLLEKLEDQLYCQRKIGVFLSGGIDSSLVAALAKEVKGEDITCITCGFEDKYVREDFDESNYAKNFTSSLGIKHIIKNVSKNDLLEVFPKLPTIYSEPFADISQIGSYLISKKARENDIVVALGGDGADELFGGYDRYINGPKLLKFNKYIPKNIAKFLIDSVYNSVNTQDIISKFLNIDKLKYKIDKYKNNFYDCDNIINLYEKTTSKWNKSELLALNLNKELEDEGNNDKESFNLSDNEARLYMMMKDLNTYLPDDVLVKVDRAAMSLGLETRSPFLNHKLAEFAFSLSTESKFRGNKGKYHLRKVLSKYSDKININNPKKGFTIPIDSILRKDLKDWSKDMINYLIDNNEFCLSKKFLINLWEDHQCNRFNNGEKIWNLITWASWIQEWR